MAEIKPVTIDEFKDYEQIRTPDFAMISSYIYRAKGPERTMASFAEETLIGASTLSRIINGKSTKPLSKENIIRIYECRADQTDVFLLEYLAKANGMFPKEFADRARSDDRYAIKRNEEINRERMMKNSLIASIVSSGMPICQVINSPTSLSRDTNVYMPRRRGNFALVLQPETPITPDTPIYSWAFFLYPQIQDQFDEERHLTIKSRVRNIIERVSSWFLMDAWDIDVIKGDKLSFCFVDENIFTEFINALQLAKLRNEMSVILMHPSDFSVLKEVWLPGEYSRLAPENVFASTNPNTLYGNDEPDDNYEEDTE